MKIVIFILICIVLAAVFFGIGSLLGTLVGKSKKKRDDAQKNRGAHV